MSITVLCIGVDADQRCFGYRGTGYFCRQGLSVSSPSLSFSIEQESDGKMITPACLFLSLLRFFRVVCLFVAYYVEIVTAGANTLASKLIAVAGAFSFSLFSQLQQYPNDANIVIRCLLGTPTNVSVSSIIRTATELAGRARGSVVGVVADVQATWRENVPDRC